MTELDTTFSVVVTLVEKLALGATNEPLMSVDIVRMPILCLLPLQQ